MALGAFDRLLTVVVTATLTSAVWIVAGGTLMQQARVASGVATQGAAPTATTTRVTASPGAGVTPAPTATTPPVPVGPLVIPVEGIRPEQLTDTFNQARGGGSRLHEALDIMAPSGTPVIAAGPGTVEKLFLSKPGGNTIYIRSSDRRTIHYYAHLKDYATGLVEGQQVARGQRLGSVGVTGNANPDGPHLHFAILGTTPTAKWWEPTTPINPYPLLTKR